MNAWTIAVSRGSTMPKRLPYDNKAAKEKIVALVGHNVTVGTRKSGSMKWKVIATY
jgi:hypothetical protein